MLDKISGKQTYSMQQKLITALLVKKLSTSYRTRRLISTFKQAHKYAIAHTSLN
jgi:hypothetical protein